MINFTDISIIVAILNAVAMAGNVISSMRLNNLKNRDEITHYWKEQADELKDRLEKQDELIKTIQEKKNQYKLNYNHQLVENKKLEGQLATYKKFHNHD